MGSRRILSTSLGVLKAVLFPDVKGLNLQLTSSPDSTRILARKCKNSWLRLVAALFYPVSLWGLLTKHLGFSSLGKRPDHTGSITSHWEGRNGWLLTHIWYEHFCRGFPSPGSRNPCSDPHTKKYDCELWVYPSLKTMGWFHQDELLLSRITPPYYP